MMDFRQFFTANKWWGKIIGAFLGYLIAGSSGALFGILIGNFFDRGLATHFSNPHWHFNAERRKEVQKIFFEATFSILGHIAKADGHISQQEINMATEIMQEMRLSNDQIQKAKNYFNAGKSASFNLMGMLSALKKAAYDNPALLKLFIDIQYRAAQVDGLSERKLQSMNSILTYLGFAPLQQQYRFYEDFLNRSSYQGHRRQSHSSSSSNEYQSSLNNLEHAYAILEVSSKANKQEVKRAYRRLMSANHPDKLIAQGLPEAMIKVANDKTQKIRKAYEQICTSKGW